MRRPVQNWWNVSLSALALLVLAGTYAHGDWGDHWVFIAAYVGIGIYALVTQRWLGLATCVSLVWLRADLMQGYDGFNLKLASTAFVVLLALLVRENRRDYA